MIRVWRSTALALLLCSGCLPPTSARIPVPATRTVTTALDSIVGDPDLRSAIIGVLIVDAVTGETLYARNAHTGLVPASNMKIVTGSVALARLGPDYRFRTIFAARGSVADSTLNGDLLVFGRGDPSFSQRMMGNPMTVLASVADSLRARGIARIAGRLVHAGNAFTGSPWGFGWSIGYVTQGYGAGVDELLFNEGLSFDSTLATGSDTLSSSPAPAPATAFMEALRFALNARGITIAGETVRDSLAAVAAGDVGFELLSAPLSTILGALEKPSQNQMAEMLLRTVALEATGAGSDTAGVRIATEQLRAWGADTLEFVLRDGSGLSRHNILSPATVVRMLLTMRQHEHFNHFYNALPAVGSEGTVRNWLRGTRASEVVRGKTGTLDMVRAFSGYATGPDGREIVFSFIANHHRTPTARVTTAIQGMLTALTELTFLP